jgi:hypothetical protein
MSKLILLSLLVCVSAALGSDSVRPVRYQAESLAPTNSPPTFDNGQLVVYNMASDSVYAPDGFLAYTIPWPENGLIAGVAVDTDQAAAAAVNVG